MEWKCLPPGLFSQSKDWINGLFIQNLHLAYKQIIKMESNSEVGVFLQRERDCAAFFPSFTSLSPPPAGAILSEDWWRIQATVAEFLPSRLLNMSLLLLSRHGCLGLLLWANPCWPASDLHTLHFPSISQGWNHLKALADVHLWSLLCESAQVSWKCFFILFDPL